MWLLGCWGDSRYCKGLWAVRENEMNMQRKTKINCHEQNGERPNDNESMVSVSEALDSSDISLTLWTSPRLFPVIWNDKFFLPKLVLVEFLSLVTDRVLTYIPGMQPVWTRTNVKLFRAASTHKLHDSCILTEKMKETTRGRFSRLMSVKSEKRG